MIKFLHKSKSVEELFGKTLVEIKKRMLSEELQSIPLDFIPKSAAE